MGKRKATDKAGASKKAKVKEEKEASGEQVRGEDVASISESNGTVQVKAEGAVGTIPGLAEANKISEGKAKGPSGSKLLKGKADDIKTWRTLAQDACNTSSATKARDMFETLLRRFPLADKYWCSYCQSELKAGNYDQVDAILKRVLLKLSSVRLWLFYLAYVRERKLGKGSKAAANPDMEKEARMEVEKAFEFALQNVGFVFEAGQIWVEYIRFIESQPCDSQFDLSNRAAAVRTARQRAVKLPLEQLEAIWKDLEDKYKTPDVQTEYMKARAIFLERKKLYATLDSGSVPEFSGLVDDTKRAAAAGDLLRWRKMLAFECGNPEKVNDVELRQRVRAAYSRTLSVFFYFPEVWYEHAKHELESGDPVSARTVLENALHAVPDSLMLHFAMADLLESRGQIPAAREVFARLEKKYPSPIVYIQSQRFERRTCGVLAARAVFRRARLSANCDSTVFTSAALLEWRCNKEAAIARNVFELGMRRYPKDIPFIIGYVRFLESLNNDDDLISLFERVLQSSILAGGAGEALPIWERYREFASRFAAQGGSLRRLEDIERRMLDAYSERPEEFSGLPAVVHRYAFLGQYPTQAPDRAFFSRCKHLSLGPHARMLNGAPVAEGGAVTGLAASSLGLADSAGVAGFAVDSTKLPHAIRRLNGGLPASLGRNVNPISTDYILSQFVTFNLPSKKALLDATRKKRENDGSGSTADDGDLFKKRRR